MVLTFVWDCLVGVQLSGACLVVLKIVFAPLMHPFLFFFMRPWRIQIRFIVSKWLSCRNSMGGHWGWILDLLLRRKVPFQEGLEVVKHLILAIVFMSATFHGMLITWHLRHCLERKGGWWMLELFMTGIVVDQGALVLLLIVLLKRLTMPLTP